MNAEREKRSNLWKTSLGSALFSSKNSFSSITKVQKPSEADRDRTQNQSSVWRCQVHKFQIYDVVESVSYTQVFSLSPSVPINFCYFLLLFLLLHRSFKTDRAPANCACSCYLLYYAFWWPRSYHTWLFWTSSSMHHLIFYGNFQTSLQAGTHDHQPFWLRHKLDLVHVFLELSFRMPDKH